MEGDTSNRALCAVFRDLLTHGAYFADDDGVIMEGMKHAVAMKRSKAWRSDLWKAFREIEDRLCPVQAHTRERQRINLEP